MSATTYRGYAARIDYDVEDKIFVGRITGISDIAGFHAENAEDTKAAFHATIDDDIETCAHYRADS